VPSDAGYRTLLSLQLLQTPPSRAIAGTAEATAASNPIGLTGTVPNSSERRCREEEEEEKREKKREKKCAGGREPRSEEREEKSAEEREGVEV